MNFEHHNKMWFDIRFLIFFSLFTASKSARTTRLPIRVTTMSPLSRWPTTTPRPPYQGYLSFMLLCEPDVKCVSVNTKLDIIECLEKGMSLAAIYLYKQCTGQGTITCDDNDTANTVKNCLKVQSGSFANLVTDSSRQCIREKVTLGNIDCYKINSRLRRGGQKFWMMSPGSHFGPIVTLAPRRDLMETTPRISIFEQAAHLKTSTTTTTTTVATTTTSTTPAPVSSFPGRHGNDNDGRPDTTTSLSQQNNFQVLSGQHHQGLSYLPSGHNHPQGTFGGNNFAIRHHHPMTSMNHPFSGFLPPPGFMTTRFIPPKILPGSSLPSHPPYIESSLFPGNSRLGNNRQSTNNFDKNNAGGGGMANGSHRPSQAPSQPEFTYEYIEYDDGQPDEPIGSSPVTQATTIPLTVMSSNRRASFDNQRRNRRVSNRKEKRTVSSPQGFVSSLSQSNLDGKRIIRRVYQTPTTASLTIPSRLTIQYHRTSSPPNLLQQQKTFLSRSSHDSSLSSASSFPPKNIKISGLTITDDDSNPDIIHDSQTVSVLPFISILSLFSLDLQSYIAFCRK